MARTRIKWNMDGFEELRRKAEVADMLLDSAEAIADEAGGEQMGYVAEPGRGRTRDRAAVIAVTPEAIRDNHENHTLIQSMDAGRQ